MNKELRSQIGSILVQADNDQSNMCDNLAIVLCCYFQTHMLRPKDDPETENGWGTWTEHQVNKILDEITEFVINKGAT